MKLEFLDDISAGGKFPWADPDQLVRLYDFSPLQAVDLAQIITRIVIENNVELNLGSLDFIDPINCNLILRISETDEGIGTIDKQHFTCNLTKQTYQKMILLMQPFSKETDGYQWLYDPDCSIDLLFSPGGTW